MGRGPGWNAEGFVQALATGATNLSGLPGVVLTWRLGLYYEFVIGVMTILTSTAYHTCESLDVTFLGYNEGRWHHMDNVFAILSFMSAFTHFAPHHRNSNVREFVNTAFCSLAIVAQLMSPWDLMYTIVPILLAVAYTLASIIISRRVLPADGRAGRLSIVFLIVSLACFAKGLDENRDWLRLYHGGWHLSIGGFSFFLLRATRSVPIPVKSHAD